MDGVTGEWGSNKREGLNKFLDSMHINWPRGLLGLVAYRIVTKGKSKGEWLKEDCSKVVSNGPNLYMWVYFAKNETVPANSEDADLI